MVGFLPADDPRIAGTVAAIERHLIRGGLVERYNTRTTSNGVGLLSEEYESRAQMHARKFPTGASHIALVHAAFTFSGTWKPDRGDGQRT